jgi:hypothetical protein
MSLAVSGIGKRDSGSIPSGGKYFLSVHSKSKNVKTKLFFKDVIFTFHWVWHNEGIFVWHQKLSGRRIIFQK